MFKPILGYALSLSSEPHFQFYSEGQYLFQDEQPLVASTNVVLLSGT
jgi:hypothetical protein